MKFRTPSREDIIWSAGLFEGEGSFTLNANGYPRAAMQMTDRDVMQRFADVWGVRLYGPYVRPGKDIFAVSFTSFEKFQFFVASVWPWLGERRRARAAEVLKGVVNRQLNSGGRCKRGHQRTPGKRCNDCVRLTQQAWRGRQSA